VKRLFKSGVFGSAGGELPTLYWFLWTGLLITRLGNVVVPFLALYLTGERGLPTATAGRVVSLFGLGSVGASFVGGWLSDHVGRRFTLLLGIFGGAGMMLVLSGARALPAIAVATLLLGLLTDLARPAVAAVIADVVPNEARVKAYALQYWAVNIGFSVAAVMGGTLAQRGFSRLFLVDAATSALYGFVVLARVPETRPQVRAAPDAPSSSHLAHPAPSGSSDSPASPFKDTRLLLFCGTALLLSLVFFQFTSALPLDMSRNGISPKLYGRVVATNAVLIVLLQPWVTGHLSRLSRRRGLALGAAFIGAGFGLTGLCRTPLQYAGAVVVWTVGELLHAPTTSAVVAELAPPGARGRYQGVYYTAWGLGMMLAPALGTWVLAGLGSAALWGGCAVVGLALAMALELGALPFLR
jgi:MFS family permease